MRMIVGHGIDIEELASIESAVTRHEGFAKRVLTAKEMERFTSLKGRRQIEYLAGRWSAKEAFSKAMGTGIGKLGFQDLEVLNMNAGRLILVRHHFQERFGCLSAYRSVCDSQCHFGGKS